MEDDRNWLPNKVTYTINSDGLNERFDYTVEKQSEVFRIITLGDSFTYGHFVNTKDNWPERLEVQLNDSHICNQKKFEVINLGMPGFDIAYTAKRYLMTGSKYNPDLIIWFESGTGFDRVNEFMKPLINECYEISTEEMKKQKTDFIDCWHEANKELVKNYSEENIHTYLHEKLKGLLSQLNQKPIIFFTFDELSPNQTELLTSWVKDYPEAQVHPIIPNLAEKTERLEDGHPNSIGHQKIATSIFDHLQKTNCK